MADPIVLVHAETISEESALDLCEALKKLACQRSTGSNAVDRPEWKAARVIWALIDERRRKAGDV